MHLVFYEISILEAIYSSSFGRLCVKPKWRPRGPWSHGFGTYYVMKLSHLGILEKKTSPLKTKCSEPITDPKEQMGRWVEHYSELYPPEAFVTNAALNRSSQ